jgi:uncharacterized protein YprB with RNaseH-like and TPR domain
MLLNTFIHLPYIGLHTEQQLWDSGLTTWDDVLKPKYSLPDRFQHLYSPLKLSKKKLKLMDARFFIERLHSDQHWRIFPEFQDVTAYLDIETTGLRARNDYITTISLYDGEKIHYYVHGKNLDQFLMDLKNYKVLVTYNGKCFDIPFIEQEFDVKLTHAQLDLRYILRSIGISGGLKSCEHQLGLTRGELEGVDGYFAVLLWREYMNGNDNALETLLAYNIEDTVNLEKLMYIAYNKKLANLHLKKQYIASTLNRQKKVKIPFLPDKPTIKEIREKYY